MCGRLLLACCVLSCLPIVSRAAEQQYLMSESQYQAIMTHLEQLESSSQNSLLQARGLKNEAESLNNLLREEREQSRQSEQYWSAYTASLLQEIVELRQEVSTERLEKARYKGAAQTRLAVIIALASVIVIAAAPKAYLFFRQIKQRFR